MHVVLFRYRSAGPEAPAESMQSGSDSGASLSPLASSYWELQPLNMQLLRAAAGNILHLSDRREERGSAGGRGKSQRQERVGR